MKKSKVQNSRANKSQVLTEFLKDLLAKGPIGVSEIEHMARAAGHLGNTQSITRSKAFLAAKKALGAFALYEPALGPALGAGAYRKPV